MSRLKYLCQGVKQHIGKIVVGVVTVGAFVGIRGCAKNMGKEIYRGNINGQEVVYEEGRFSYWNKSMTTKNRLTIFRDDKTYILEDAVSETDIQWKRDDMPVLEKDELDGITIKEGKKMEFLYHNGEMGSWNPTTIDDRRKKEIFERGNQMYNDLRTQIREQLRAQYEAQPNPLE
ncbi:MAG: hypothetical protein ISS82_03375 [Nanoarchaeota archaeon]|nr:hypothetical protein [Nanoarchaeota archaeon]